MAKDLVCRMEVNPETAPAKTEYRGWMYFVRRAAKGYLRSSQKSTWKELGEMGIPS
ncbi:MAG: hypothetical protein ACLFV5_04130 [Anaerolineales bacterium]